MEKIWFYFVLKRKLQTHPNTTLSSSVFAVVGLVPSSRLLILHDGDRKAQLSHQSRIRYRGHSFRPYQELIRQGGNYREPGVEVDLISK